MACLKRLNTGNCGHDQCPFAQESGYDCVDIVIGYCEVGDGCFKDCPYSWPTEDHETTQKAMTAFEKKYNY